jgi:sugar (pentulose or hexulose) kinase
LERRLGKQRYLKLAGNRPFPGSISCTTWAWFLRHAPEVMKKADLCGHLNTFLHRQLTGARVIDPSNASFTGFYHTPTLGGWNDALMENVGIQRHRLPQVIGADGIGGFVTHEATRRFGLTHGTPVLAGLVDTSAAMLLAGARRGQLVNVTGSTDVLALCTSRAYPHEKLLTRALGVGKLFVSAATLAAAGSSLTWARRELFPDLSDRQYWTRVGGLSKVRQRGSSVEFDPYLAGERASIEQRAGAFTGLTLATTREDLLSAMIDALGRASAQRLELLAQASHGRLKRATPMRMRRDVLVSGGSKQLSEVLRREWPGSWRSHQADHATLRGLALLVPRET